MFIQIKSHNKEHPNENDFYGPVGIMGTECEFA